MLISLICSHVEVRCSRDVTQGLRNASPDRAHLAPAAKAFAADEVREEAQLPKTGELLHLTLPARAAHSLDAFTPCAPARSTGRGRVVGLEFCNRSTSRHALSFCTAMRSESRSTARLSQVWVVRKHR